MMGVAIKILFLLATSSVFSEAFPLNSPDTIFGYENSLEDESAEYFGTAPFVRSDHVNQQGQTVNHFQQERKPYSEAHLRFDGNPQYVNDPADIHYERDDSPKVRIVLDGAQFEEAAPNLENLRTTNQLIEQSNPGANLARDPTNPVFFDDDIFDLDDQREFEEEQFIRGILERTQPHLQENQFRDDVQQPSVRVPVQEGFIPDNQGQIFVSDEARQQFLRNEYEQERFDDEYDRFIPQHQIRKEIFIGDTGTQGQYFEPIMIRDVDEVEFEDDDHLLRGNFQRQEYFDRDDVDFRQVVLIPQVAFARPIVQEPLFTRDVAQSANIPEQQVQAGQVSPENVGYASGDTVALEHQRDPYPANEDVIREANDAQNAAVDPVPADLNVRGTPAQETNQNNEETAVDPAPEDFVRDDPAQDEETIQNFGETVVEHDKTLNAQDALYEQPTQDQSGNIDPKFKRY